MPESFPTVVTYINPATLEVFSDHADGLVSFGQWARALDRAQFRMDLAKMRNLSNIGNAAYRNYPVATAGYYSAAAEEWVTRAEGLLAVPGGLVPIDGIGDQMDLETFLCSAQAGAYVDYDGYGSWATETLQSVFHFRPSEVLSGHDWAPLWATHVLWYNR